MNGQPFAPFVGDRRLWLALLISGLAVALGFFAIPSSTALRLVTNFGYWIVLVTFIIFLRALWRVYRNDVLAVRAGSIDWASVGIVGVCGMVLLVHETFGFKIIMDEIMLLGTSMSMHFQRTVLTPTRGNDIQGAFLIMEGMLDKRPLFFPFLVSIIHDVIGYRTGNPFILNGILTFIFLGLLFVFGRKVAGRQAGWIGVILFAGLPLLGQNATGGGFELLNLVMILATLMIGIRFLECRDEDTLTALCFSAILLTQVRYESAIFLLPVVALVLWVWWQEKRVILSWPVILIPILVIHCALQHRAVFEAHVSSWQLESKPGLSKAFSTDYFLNNLGHAGRYFFAKPADQPNSVLLSILGCLAIPFLLLRSVRRLANLRNESAVSVVTTIFCVGFAAHFLLLMLYFWGEFDDIVIRRLSLPTHLWMVIAILAVIPEIKWPPIRKVLLGAAIFSLFAIGVPSMASHAYNQEYLPGFEAAWRRQFMADQPKRDYLMIDNDSILWITHQVSSTTVEHTIKDPAAIIFFMKNRTFSNVFVFQRYKIDPDNGQMTLRDGDDLGPKFILEPVREERLLYLTLDRISRIKEVKEGAIAPKAASAPAVSLKDPAEAEKIREAYLENFIKQLP